MGHCRTTLQILFAIAVFAISGCATETDRGDANAVALEALAQAGSSAAGFHSKKHRPACVRDDPRTPGDDRAGYVSCADPTSGARATCGPSLGCCPKAGPSCAATGTECRAGQPFFDACDGPEDCISTGLPCWQGRFGKICSVPSGGASVVCHTDADCASDHPLCYSGTCIEVMSTVGVGP